MKEDLGKWFPFIVWEIKDNKGDIDIWANNIYLGYRKTVNTIKFMEKLFEKLITIIFY